MEFDKDIMKAGLNQTLKIAQERTRTLDNLRSALLEDDDESIKLYAAKLCGLNQTEINQAQIKETQGKKAKGKKGGNANESGGIPESIDARTG